MTQIDFHSHILPGMDDGSRDVAESLAMLRMEAEQGIADVIATPHFYGYNDDPLRFLERRAQAETLLQQALETHEGLPRVTMGAEVFYCRGISEWEFLPRLTIDGSSCVLIEMPPAPWPETVYQELEEIWTKRGITPIIAHIDRYIGPLRDYGIPERLRQLPVLVQANGAFFLKWDTAAMAMRLLKTGHIQLLGSDCHGASSRKPNLGSAFSRISRKLGAETVERFCQNGARVFSL